MPPKQQARQAAGGKPARPQQRLASAAAPPARGPARAPPPQPQRRRARQPEPEPEPEEEEEEDEGGSSSGGEEDSEDDSEEEELLESDEDEKAAAGNDDDDDEDDEDEDQDEVEVNFEFFDPRPNDFHGIKTLLNGYLDGASYDVSGLADAIINQAGAGVQNLGTLVKNDPEEAPVGLLTILPLSKHKSDPWCVSLLAFLRDKLAGDAAGAGRLEAALTAGGRTGLIVSERVLNCPPQLAPPLLTALFDELAWKASDEPDASVRSAFSFDRYLLLSRAWTDASGDDGAAGGPGSKGGIGVAGGSGGPAGGAGGKRGRAEAAGGGGGGAGPAGKRPKGGAGGAGGPVPVLVFVRPEDEVFASVAAWKATFAVPKEVLGEKSAMAPVRLLLLFDAKKVPAARKAVDQLVLTF